MKAYWATGDIAPRTLTSALDGGAHWIGDWVVSIRRSQQNWSQLQ